MIPSFIMMPTWVVIGDLLCICFLVGLLARDGR